MILTEDSHSGRVRAKVLLLITTYLLATLSLVILVLNVHHNSNRSLSFPECRKLKDNKSTLEVQNTCRSRLFLQTILNTRLEIPTKPIPNSDKTIFGAGCVISQN